LAPTLQIASPPPPDFNDGVARSSDLLTYQNIPIFSGDVILGGYFGIRFWDDILGCYFGMIQIRNLRS
jgi:hypothetical protein